MTISEAKTRGEGPQAGAARPPGQLLRRVPGRATPRKEMLAEFDEYRDRVRKGVDPVLWPLVAPAADGQYRWLVQLACGCVQEALTRGRDRFPDEVEWRNYFTSGTLPVGQRLCREHKALDVKPYRRIMEWLRVRRVDFPPDAEPKPRGAPAEIQAWLTRTEPHSSNFWTVRLECGHETEVVAKLGWSPKDGPVYVSEERRLEMLAELAEYDEEHPSDRHHADREHWTRMIQEGWPMPATETDCWTCTHAFEITGYQRVGWLVPPPKPPAPPLSKRERLERQLQRAEDEAAKLRSRLEDL